MFIKINKWSWVPHVVMLVYRTNKILILINKYNSATCQSIKPPKSSFPAHLFIYIYLNVIQSKWNQTSNWCNKSGKLSKQMLSKYSTNNFKWIKVMEIIWKNWLINIQIWNSRLILKVCLFWLQIKSLKICNIVLCKRNLLDSYWFI